jgi:hypothetical protein
MSIHRYDPRHFLSLTLLITFMAMMEVVVGTVVVTVAEEGIIERNN